MVNSASIQDSRDDEDNWVTFKDKATRKRKLQVITHIKEKVLKVVSPEPSLHEVDLLRKPLQVEELMSEDSFPYPIASCNMMSVVRNGNPRFCGEPHRVLML